MIKYRSRSHYTLLQIRSGNTAKTESELADIANQTPSTIKRAIAVLLRNKLIEEVEATRTFTYGHQKGQSYTVPAYTVAPKGVETLLYLARQQERQPQKSTEYNYEKLLERQARYRRMRRETV